MVVRTVRTKDQLDAAIREKADFIVIKDKKLGKRVRKLLSSKKLVAVVAAGGGAAGLASLAVPLTWPIWVVILAIGAAIVYRLVVDYRVKARGRVTLPGGIEAEGEVILERR